MGRACLEHRLVWLMHHDEWPAEIDHINGIRDDNRIENLRLVTRADNMRNSRRRKDNTSGVMGVSWHSATGKWRAYIGGQDGPLHLGMFADWFDAVCARKSAERRQGYHANHGR